MNQSYPELIREYRSIPKNEALRRQLNVYKSWGSAALEGYFPTPEDIKQMISWVNGFKTDSDILNEIVKEYTT